MSELISARRLRSLAQTQGGEVHFALIKAAALIDEQTAELSRLRPPKEGEAVAWAFELEDGSRHLSFGDPRKRVGVKAETAAPLYASPPVALPEGWQLVPIKPTSEMLVRAQRVGLNLHDIWEAMLSSSPQAKTGDKP